jgi:hypothetical protein
MSQLMYSAADTLVTYDNLCAVPTPAPMGAFHQPVGFGDFLELIKHRMSTVGIAVATEEYCLDETGQTFFGVMELSLDGFTRDDMSITLGVRGSHNQKVPRAITLGNRVMVCSNLCFSGDLGTVSTKQTTNVWQRLPGLIDQSVAKIPQLAQREIDRADAYKMYGMKPRVGDAALVELTRQGALTSGQLGRAIDEWDRPSYEEHAQDGFNAWRLLNAVTEVQKPTGTNVNMDTVRQRTSRAVEWLDSVVGL